MNTVIKNAHIIEKNKIGDLCDLKIENGKITQIAPEIHEKGIDIGGKILSRGLIDMHCHLREPGFEYKETIKSGIASAIAGGYCGLCPMPNTNPTNDNPEVLKFILKNANGYNLFPICAVTRNLTSDELTNFQKLKDIGAIAFSNDGKPIVNEKVLAKSLKSGFLIISHAEIPHLHGNAQSEYEAVSNELRILRETGGKYHFAHISTKESVEYIRQAKKEGLNVTCETAPHYFALTQTKESLQNPIFKVNPPLRNEDDRIAVIEGLKDGTIDAIATDHAPHSRDEKTKHILMLLWELLVLKQL